MNKGLEVIEAHELFGDALRQIEVVVHPQSIVHSMVEFTDGATIAQLSLPDMRLPIGYALGLSRTGSAPRSGGSTGDARPARLRAARHRYFRCLALAYAAGRAGRHRAGVAHAANEVAVDASSPGGSRWPLIADTVDAVLQHHPGDAPTLTGMTSSLPTPRPIRPPSRS